MRIAILLSLFSLFLSGCTGQAINEYCENEPNDRIDIANAVNTPALLIGSVNSTDVDCWAIPHGSKIEIVSGEVHRMDYPLAVCVRGQGDYVLHVTDPM